jgi:hypothetical protein
VLNLDRIRTWLIGVAAGLLFAVLDFRGTAVSAQSLDELRDGALLLLVASVVLSIWHARAASKQRAS